MKKVWYLFPSGTPVLTTDASPERPESGACYATGELWRPKIHLIWIWDRHSTQKYRLFDNIDFFLLMTKLDGTDSSDSGTVRNEYGQGGTERSGGEDFKSGDNIVGVLCAMQNGIGGEDREARSAACLRSIVLEGRKSRNAVLELR